MEGAKRLVPLGIEPLKPLLVEQLNLLAAKVQPRLTESEVATLADSAAPVSVLSQCIRCGSFLRAGHKRFLRHHGGHEKITDP